MSKVTVLTAVYNAHATIVKCLDSLLGQTLRDIQIVCIDDASTDESLALLRQYASKDSRIKVLSLSENHGQAYARNQGLAIADGEYITMVDSDDWLSPDALEQAVTVFREHPHTGCALFDLQYIWPDGRQKGYEWHYTEGSCHRREDGSFDVMTGCEAFKASLSWGIHGVYMAKADLFKTYPYDATCRHYSDDNTTRLHYLASDEVRCCRGTYYYLQRDGSVSHNISVRRMDWITAADSMRRQLREIHMDTETMRTIEWERWKVLVDCYGFYHRHRRHFSAADRSYCLEVLRRAWQDTDVQMLKGSPIHKLGWYPFAGRWQWFVMEENTYFFIKKIIGR